MPNTVRDVFRLINIVIRIEFKLPTFVEFHIAR